MKSNPVNSEFRATRPVTCAKCHHVNLSTVKACESCGSRLFITCHHCGRRNDRVAPACSHCGHSFRRSAWRRLWKKLAPAGRRRLTVFQGMLLVLAVWVVYEVIVRLAEFNFSPASP